MPLALAPILLALAVQGVPAESGQRIDAAVSTVTPPIPALIAPWAYPKGTAPRLVRQSILPREVDVLRVRTSDTAEQVERYYRERFAAEGGPVGTVSCVGQRMVFGGSTLVSIEPANGYTIVTVIASEPEPDPDAPQPLLTPKRGVRPPPS